MFNRSIDDRISSWAEFRNNLNLSQNPWQDIWEFWKDAPYIPYNNKIDPFHQWNWPSPWEIIAHNQYDDFTKALMIGWTIKLTPCLADKKIEVRTLVDKEKSTVYNIVFIDEEIGINYSDNGPILVKNIPDRFFLENLVELKRPR